MFVKLGTTIPLYVILKTNDTDKIVTCEIIEPRTPSKIASNLILAPVGGSPGHYHDASVLMPPNANLIASYRVYESDGVTLYGSMTQDIALNQMSSDPGSIVASNQSYSNLSATVDDGSLSATVSIEEA